ncbi:hypothetical protein ABO04_06930 [Nitrosomonas sp. HPC101]|uniref:hypothetical protein n=1 Tax=Nitrosomonas sp. HPC101 TaxID=1658667 RepID=UPI001368922F|nr:hypothetical protein [Nitrosomonas sp. HPC101]MXS85645.1 hypothetical protein [Nitrosomonas sp. HPC101]
MNQSTFEQSFPDFFTDVPAVMMRDPLARFLGTARDGIMVYRYVDAVRLAGHSCPTVAGTWLMTIHGLRALYGDELPVRGEIEVFMADVRDAGTTGVVATVVQLVTGAAPETGFHGIGGRFGRNDLLHFDQPMQGEFGLRRKDTGAAVQMALDAAVVPWPNEMRLLFPKAVSGQADSIELQRFGKLWQERVRQMLIDHADDTNLVKVSSWIIN